jgi:hypothetical protein
MIELFNLVFSLVRSIFRPDAELTLEDLALRHLRSLRDWWGLSAGNAWTTSSWSTRVSRAA